MEGNLESDPQLIAAAIINGVVNDLLYQSDFQFPHFPEWCDLAVVMTGLGVLRSGVGFVKKTALHWDSTRWDSAPRPFLNIPSLAYANALATWVRGDIAPDWTSDLNSELRRPMRASLKYLQKTSDSFFRPNEFAQSIESKTKSHWWQQLTDTMPSTQVIALRLLETEGQVTGGQETTLASLLRSNNRAIVLHSIAAVERLNVDTDVIAKELRSLVNDRDDEIRAKSLCVLTTLGLLDNETIQMTDDLLESHFKHNVFAGVYALSTLDSVPEHILPSVQNAFMRALKSCDYEFVGLFAAAYKRWFQEPRAEVEVFLQDSPELLPIAVEAIEGTPQELVTL